MSNDNTPWIEPEEFATVKTNEEIISSCTPKEPTDRYWEGLLINAPKTVRARKGQQFFIPVCVIGILPFTALNEPEIMIFAINTKSHKVHKGPALIEPPIEDYVIPQPPNSEYSVEELTGTSSGTNFTSDLYENANLPSESAEYTVYVQRGEIKSNEVIIQVVWEK